MNAITQLSDKALITETLGLRGKEKEILHQLLILFGEIDSRKLYRDEGYPSLFVYLHEGLGYSKSGAYPSGRGISPLERSTGAVRRARNGEALLQLTG